MGNSSRRLREQLRDILRSEMDSTKEEEKPESRPTPFLSRRLSIHTVWRENRLALVASIKSSSRASESPGMEQSPLTQQTRPDVFEPKVVELYRRLFKDIEDDEKPEGFWRELFLLKPDLQNLRQILEEAEPDLLIHLQHHTQDFVRQAIVHIRAAQSPADENALDTWTVFFAVVLAKKYTNPSSDIIEVLAGLDDADSIIPELVATLDHTIRDGRTMSIRQKATRTAIAVVSGGYHTALISYFINRDFFPTAMKMVQQLDNPLQASEPLLLIGLLANYNKFEIHNQYRIRFADFINDDAIRHIIDSVLWTCTLLRERYVAIQDDTPATWSLSGTLSYVGLGALTKAKPSSPPLSEEEQKTLFQEQSVPSPSRSVDLKLKCSRPGLEAASLITLLDFVLANKLFCQHFINQPSATKGEAPPFSNFLSFASYSYHHAYRTHRASVYAYMTSLILLVLLEDAATAKLVSDNTAVVRLCRQRSPFLPISTGERPYAAAILDLLTDGVNHNLRKRLDTAFYSKLLLVALRLLSYLSKSRIKLPYHWAELWRSLLAFLRFLTTYADDMRNLPYTSEVLRHLLDILALGMNTGESFLPDPASYDDLLYKLVESGEALTKLRDAYQLAKPDDQTAVINTLIGVSKHYHELIETQRSKSQVLTTREVAKIIKQGYETLSFEARETVERAERFREAEHKTELKRITRVAVHDAVALVAR